MNIPIIISGPSGVGKDTLVKSITSTYPEIKEAVGYTTRKPRENEVNGVDLNFVSKDYFRYLINHDMLIEYALFNNEFYGMPKTELTKLRDQKMIYNIGVSGARTIKELIPESIAILLIPPSYNELVYRLGNRGKERLKNMASDLKEASSFFDYCLVSKTDKVDELVENFKDILSGHGEEYRIENYFNRIKDITHIDGNERVL